MAVIPRRTLLGGLLGVLLSRRALAASQGGGPPAGAGAQDDLVEGARAYEAALERLAAVREAELVRASQTLERFSDLYARGLVARRDVEDAARMTAEARARLEETRRDLAAAGTLIAEAEARRQLASLGPSPPDDVRSTDRLVRYDGPRAWALRDLPGVERFFAGRFGRPLPISALGQTPIHTRLGLDHARAVDVALHPDTVEGRGLLSHLRTQRIPFLAFRAAVAGASTGAHVHIGRPSDRLARRPLP